MSHIIPHYRSIQQLLQNRTFTIDEYQREYKWDKKHIIELLVDLSNKFKAFYRSGDKTQAVSQYDGYFLGSIIISKRDNTNFLVDGQQRITSLTLLLIYLYREAKYRHYAVDTTIAPLIYSDNLGNPSFNLVINERLTLLESLFYGDDFNIDNKTESVQTMYQRYQDIQEYDLADDLKEAFPHFVYWLLTKVGLIEIETENDNDAYTIFETMNDRGKPLSPIDMLKAFLLAGIKGYDQKYAMNQLWKKETLALSAWNSQLDKERDAVCVKAWFRAQYANSAGSIEKDWEAMGTAFHRWVRDNASSMGLTSSKQYLQFLQLHFPFFFKAYTLILDASTTLIEGLETLYYNAQKEFTWQNTVLLAPLCVNDDSVTVRKKIAITATFLDIWIMRRISNNLTVSYSYVNYPMFLLCKEIRRKSVTDLAELLIQKLETDDVTFSGAPQKNRLGIKNLKLNQFNRRYIYHMLARLTTFIEIKSDKPNLFVSYTRRDAKNPFDIEHIWPDKYSKFSENYKDNESFQHDRNHIAGLLLLPADVNRSLKDKEYSYKVKHYVKQNLLAASFCAETYQHQPKFKKFISESQLPFQSYDVFQPIHQLERRKLIKKLVEQVWSVDRIKELI